MFDLYGAYASWIGLLTAAGVLVAVIAFALARGAGERGRDVVSAAGAVLLLFVTTRALSGVRDIVTAVATEGLDADGGRRVTDVVLLLVGLLVGATAVFVARSLAARPPYDYDDDLDDEDDDEDEAPGWLAGHDLLAVALAIGLPVLGSARYGLGAEFAFVHGAADVTAAGALMQLLAGLLAGGALLAFVRRDAGGQFLAGAFGLVVVGAIVLPIWPETFANEFWTSFATGLAAGLLLAVALPVLAAAIPSDRFAALIGAAAALVLVVVMAVVAGRVNDDLTEGSLRDFQEEFDGSDGIMPEIVYPSGFPTDLLPSGLETFP